MGRWSARLPARLSEHWTLSDQTSVYLFVPLFCMCEHQLLHVQALAIRCLFSNSIELLFWNRRVLLLKATNIGWRRPGGMQHLHHLVRRPVAAGQKPPYFGPCAARLNLATLGCELLGPAEPLQRCPGPPFGRPGYRIKSRNLDPVHHERRRQPAWSRSCAAPRCSEPLVTCWGGCPMLLGDTAVRD